MKQMTNGGGRVAGVANADAGHGPEVGGQGSEAREPRGDGRLAEEFINKAEVARRLRKTVRCVDNWMGRGFLPYYKIGRSVAFKWSEIEAALARKCRVCRG